MPSYEAASYTDRPWLAQYRSGDPSDFVPRFGHASEMLEATVKNRPKEVAVRYFDAALTWSELDRQSSALAAALQELGVGHQDRVSIFLQNVPQAVIGIAALWKIGAIAHLVNPMMRVAEIVKQCKDVQPAVIIAHEYLYDEVLQYAAPEIEVEAIITTSELDYLKGAVPAPLEASRRQHFADALDFVELVEKYNGVDYQPVPHSPQDISQVMYTSGSTGEPKAAQSTHANVVFNSEAYTRWLDLNSDDVCYVVSPLVHVTGAIAFMGASVMAQMPMVMSFRFYPEYFLRAVHEYRVTYTITTHTALTALLDHPDRDRYDLSSLSKLHSGVVDEVLDRWSRQFGFDVLTGYGSTECTSAAIWVPLGTRPPRDPETGKRSIGVPMYNTMVRVVDDNGVEVPVGEAGELVITGPQVGSGYWNRPDVDIFRDGTYVTGDVGYMNADGWFFLLDRKRDMIDASGFKVSPIEVENVLYEHPAILDAAVVGIPDPKRGQTVKAFVTLRKDHDISAADLITFCSDRMAAYKYPRVIDIVNDMPRSSVGKILKNQLVSTNSDAAPQKGKVS